MLAHSRGRRVLGKVCFVRFHYYVCFSECASVCAFVRVGEVEFKISRLFAFFVNDMIFFLSFTIPFFSNEAIIVIGRVFQTLSLSLNTSFFRFFLFATSPFSFCYIAFSICFPVLLFSMLFSCCFLF